MHKIFIKLSLEDISNLQNRLKNEAALLPESVQRVVFKSESNFDQGAGEWAHISKIEDAYTKSVAELTLNYRALREKVAIVQERLNFSDEGIYEQLKSDIRVKSMGAL